VWCFSTPEEREWWGSSWAERATESDFAARAIESGHADLDDLKAIAAAWREWSSAQDGWFSLLHGEVLARK
jgi:hypothetical protein